MKMKTLILSFALACSPAFALDKAAFTEADAVRAIDAGSCGTLGLGTGLVRGRGWLHQPIPGPVTIRTASEVGTIQTISMRNRGIAPQHEITIDMNAGQPYFVMVNWAMSGDYLEWKVPGYMWGSVPVGFQLPPVEQR